MVNVENVHVCQNCGVVTLKNESPVLHEKRSIGYPIMGWIFFVMSLIFIPPFFGTAALIMGFLTYHDRSKVHGLLLMLFAAAGLVLGTLFSFMVNGTMFI